MKKIILIFCFVVLSIQTTNAIEIVFNYPVFGDLGSIVQQNNSGTANSDRIAIFGTGTLSSTKFCESFGYTLISDIQGSILNTDSAYWDELNNTWTYWNIGVKPYELIKCDNPVQSQLNQGNNIYGCTLINALNYDPQANKNDGTCFYTDIENIDKGINKDIFTRDDLKNIYEVEVVIMIMFLFIRFLSRITGFSLIKKRKFKFLPF